jgi:hypothetical protein
MASTFRLGPLRRSVLWRGDAAVLIGIGVIGLVIVLINVLFNYMLFNAKS